MNGLELRREIAEMLLDKIKEDRFPSVTMMERVEAVVGQDPEAMSDYAEVLLDKVKDTRFPSTEMLNRLDRIAAQMP
jgi:ribosome-binding factor A